MAALSLQSTLATVRSATEWVTIDLLLPTGARHRLDPVPALHTTADLCVLICDDWPKVRLRMSRSRSTRQSFRVDLAPPDDPARIALCMHAVARRR